MAREEIWVDYHNAMAETVGKHGVLRDELFGQQALLERYHEELVRERRAGQLCFADLPYQRDAVCRVESAARRVRSWCENFVVLGIGGSALGNIALQTALKTPYYNLLDRSARRSCPKVFVEDNIDPVRFGALLDLLDPRRTCFNVISKSGETAETMAQFLVVRALLKKRLGRNYRRHIIVTTGGQGGVLRSLAEQEGYETLEVPEGVGGRFSVLSPVGLLSAAVSGSDIRQLLAGAAAMDRRCQSSSLKENPAYLLATLLHLADTRRGLRTVVFMPYSEQLKDVADWFRQLWAESLGKRRDCDGRDVFAGQNPVKALGTTDQHSQIQLYVEGSFDKVIMFLAVDRFARVVRIPRAFPKVEGAAYLGGRSFNELMAAELRGTAVALTEAGRPNLTIHVPRISEHHVGQLLFLLELQTAMAGKLYHVNAFDQPGVEAGKRAAYALMGRAGFEAEGRRIAERFSQDHSDRV